MIRPGLRSAETVCLVDLLATCADLLGVRLPDSAGEDSVSNLPVWRGQALDRALCAATVHHSADGSFSLRQGRWKLEMCPGSGGWSYPRPGDECKDLPPIQLYESGIGHRRAAQRLLRASRCGRPPHGALDALRARGPQHARRRAAKLAGAEVGAGVVGG